MSVQKGIQVLRQAGALTTAEMASGFPLWLPFGTEIAERFYKTYMEELGRETDFVELESPLLIRRDIYTETTETTYDYRNMFSLEVGSEEYIVRPDNLVAAAQAMTRARCQLPVVMQGSLYRSESEHLRPLFRDRHIWCVVQVAQNCESDAITDTMSRHYKVFDRFLQRLCLAVQHVDNPPIRNHSLGGIYSYVFPDPESLALIGTLYRLAPAMVQRLGLTGDVVDLGFTAKILAIAAGIHSDDQGLVLPMALCPTLVTVICKANEDREQAEKVVERLKKRFGRVKVESQLWRQGIKEARRKGVPVSLLIDSQGTSKLLQRSGSQSRALEPDCEQAVSAALALHDSDLAARSSAVRGEALRLSKASKIAECSDELAQAGWHNLGAVLPGPFDVDQSSLHRKLNFFSRSRRLY